MAALTLQLTNAGLAAVTAPDGTARTVIAELGLTAQPFIAAPTLTALPGEFKRLDILSGTAAAPNVAHITAYDTSSDVWNATGFGLYLENGTLFAAFSASEPVLSKAGVAFALMAFDIAINASILAEITFGDATFVWPPATQETRGVIELATPAEAATGTDAQRALTPATARAALLAWIMAQDGSGSGVDADLLDGQHGSWYSNIPARLGYTPLDATAYTAADVLAKLLTVDGAGTGLDADTLDGQQGAWYSDIPARLGYTPLAAAAYTAGDVLAKLRAVDGAGSGIDADTLDGRHAAQLVPSGIIAGWAGSVASVPDGWALCNGTNGTPDLRDRFVIGAGGGQLVGATGGTGSHSHAITVAGHSLTEAQMPPHSHPMFANIANDTEVTGATSVAVRTTTSPGESEYSMRTGAGADATLGLTGVTGSGAEHSHGAGADIADHLPPYYALAFIMKL